jgi:hypothetical protein
MGLKKILGLQLLSVCMAVPVIAQQGNLGDEQINVVKPYQPTLSDAFKISDVPGRDTAVVYIPDFKYQISEIQYPTVYTISPIKAVKIKDENIKKLYRGYVKAGYGTKNTPYAELFYNSLRSKIYDAGLHLKHFSSSGKIKGYGKPGMSESAIDVYGSRFFENTVLRGDLGYERSTYHWYGYNSPPDKNSSSATRHSFDDVYGNFSFRSTDKNKDSFRYSAGLGFYNISDNKKNDESNFILTTTAGKPFNGFDLNGELSLDFLQHETEFSDQDKLSIIRFNPRLVKTIDKLKLTAGANVAIEINDLTKYHLYPHARVDYTLISDMLSIYGQLTGNLRRNSWRGYIKENPFIANSVVLKNTNDKFDVSAGVYAKIDKQLAFIASGSLMRLTNDVFYRNTNGVSTLVLYDVLYDNNTQANLHAEIVYDHAEKAGLNVSADYYANDPSNQTKPLFRPSFRFGINGYYAIGEKIFISSQWSYIASRKALNTAINGEYITLKGYMDGNISVDYRYTKVMSVFLNVNNITASKYSRWYNYPSYRFSAMAGLTYSF